MFSKFLLLHPLGNQEQSSLQLGYHLWRSLPPSEVTYPLKKKKLYHWCAYSWFNCDSALFLQDVDDHGSSLFLLLHPAILSPLQLLCFNCSSISILWVLNFPSPLSSSFYLKNFNCILLIVNKFGINQIDWSTLKKKNRKNSPRNNFCWWAFCKPSSGYGICQKWKILTFFYLFRKGKVLFIIIWLLQSYLHFFYTFVTEILVL